MTREEMLHDAICHAVSIMNMSIDIARSEDGRRAKDILRKALIDYADAASPLLPAPLVEPEDKASSGSLVAQDSPVRQETAAPAFEPLPWTYRRLRTHIAIEAANGVRVAEIRWVGRPDGTTSEGTARFILSKVNA